MANDISRAIKAKTDAQLRKLNNEQKAIVTETATGFIQVSDPSVYSVPYAAGDNIDITTIGAYKYISAIMNLLEGNRVTISAPDVNGAVTISIDDYLSQLSGAALPTPGVDYRGQIFTVFGEPGTADLSFVCHKDAADVYKWVPIMGAPFLYGTILVIHGDVLNIGGLKAAADGTTVVTAGDLAVIAATRWTGGTLTVENGDAGSASGTRPGIVASTNGDVISISYSRT